MNQLIEIHPDIRDLCAIQTDLCSDLMTRDVTVVDKVSFLKKKGKQGQPSNSSKYFIFHFLPRSKRTFCTLQRPVSCVYGNNRSLF